jgi:hypothetical protein
LNISLSDINNTKLPRIERNKKKFNEKRETLGQFINNKRKIFMKSMAINIKTEQIEYLEEYL